MPARLGTAQHWTCHQLAPVHLPMWEPSPGAVAPAQLPRCRTARQAHLSVKTPRPQQGTVQNVSPVGGCNDDDTGVALEAIHLSQQLVQGLLTLVIAAANTSAA